jgi:hypothetical protein
MLMPGYYRSSPTPLESHSSRPLPRMLRTLNKLSSPWHDRSRSEWAPRPLTTSPPYKSDKVRASNLGLLEDAVKADKGRIGTWVEKESEFGLSGLSEQAITGTIPVILRT